MTTKTFTAYKHHVRPLGIYPSVFDGKTRLPKLLKSMDEANLCEVLDAITLTMQAGKVSKHGWPQQFFANRKAFDGFLEELESYDDCYRITDEWWMALAKLAGNEGGEEEGFITTSDIAQEIGNKAEKDGLLVNFGKKSPTYKYSPQECEAAEYRLTVTAAQRLWTHDMTEQELADNRKQSEIAAFNRDYFDIDLTPERKAAAIAEGKALLKAKKPAKAKTKAKAKATAKK